MSIEKFSGILNNKVKEGFTIVLTSVVQVIKDPSVLGLYVYLASLPPEWDINVKHLQSHFDKGKNLIYSWLTQLMELRLLERTEYRQSGRFVKYTYNLYISPLPCLPEAVQPEAVNRDTYKVNKQIQNKEDINLCAEAPEKEKEVYEYPETLYEKPKPKRTLSLADMLDANPFSIPSDYIEDWMEVRKVKRAPITMTVWSSLHKELQKCKENKLGVIDSFELMIANGWSTLKFEWLRGNLTPKTKVANALDFESTDWVNGIADKIRIYHD